MSEHPFNLYVGQRIKLARKDANMPQEALADALHVAPSQIEKYEDGSNRICCARLYEISQCLDRPVAFFVEGFKAVPSSSSKAFSINNFLPAVKSENSSAVKALDRKFF